jgi:exopolysaccharide biosynthesis predicted pyruvyltransferase EpsI
MRHAPRRGLEHPRLTLLFRDRASFEIGAAVFAAPAALCPDTAFTYARTLRAGRRRTRKSCASDDSTRTAPAIFNGWKAPAMCTATGPYSPAALAEWLLHRLLKRLHAQNDKQRTQAAVEGTTTTAFQLVGHAMVCAAMRHIARYRVVVTDRPTRPCARNRPRHSPCARRHQRPEAERLP